MIRIDKIRIVKRVDEVSDISDLGQYSEKPGPADRTIGRKARNDMGPREVGYFVAAMSAEETGNPDSVEQDYCRAEAFNRGEWGFVGIRAEAVVSYETTNDCRRVETLRSAGIWGLESDSDSEDLEQTEQEELDDLYEHLGKFGVCLDNWELVKAQAEHISR